MSDRRARPFSEDLLRSIAHDLLPCEHGRYLSMAAVAGLNGLNGSTLSRLLHGPHSQHNLFRALQFELIEDEQSKMAFEVAEHLEIPNPYKPYPLRLDG